jgi:type I restriction enzyme S subunit
MTNALTGHDVEEGELPEGWEPSALGQVAKWGSGGTPKSGVTRYYGGDIPWAVIRDLNDDVVLTTESSITDEGLNESSAKMIEPGSVLVAMYGSIGKLGLAGQPMSTNQAIAFANPLSDCITERFLFYFLMSQRELLLRAGKGATQQNISQTILKSWPISVPPLEEQERIVEILEDQLSRLDTALESVRTVREKAAQFRRSLLHAAFTGALTGHDVEEGELPEGWTHPLLDEINDPDRPICYGILMPGPDLPEGVPYVKVKNMRDDRVLLEGVHRTSPEIEQKFARSRLRTGDLLLSIRGTFGRTAIVPSELDGGNVTQDTARIAPIGAKTSYLFRYLQSPQAQNFFRTVARGVAVRGVNIRDLRQLPVVVPPPSEQDQIVEILEDQLSRLDTALAVADAVEERSQALRRSLLHSAFTGRLTREWREAVNV